MKYATAGDGSRVITLNPQISDLHTGSPRAREATHQSLQEEYRMKERYVTSTPHCPCCAELEVAPSATKSATCSTVDLPLGCSVASDAAFLGSLSTRWGGRAGR